MLFPYNWTEGQNPACRGYPAPYIQSRHTEQNAIRYKKTWATTGDASMAWILDYMR